MKKNQATKMAGMASVLLTLTMSGCQTLSHAPNMINITKSDQNGLIDIEQLKNQRWQLLYVINPDGYMMNLKGLQFSHEFAYFDISDNNNKAQYERVTSMSHIINFNFGCNSFGAGVTLNKDKLIVDDRIIQTLIGCGDSEDDLKNALKGENKLSLDTKTNRLTLHSHNNYRFVWEGIDKPKRIIPTQKDLESYDWQLNYIIENNMAIGGFNLPQSENSTDLRKYPILSFENGKAYYSVGCNQLSSNYTVTPYGIANSVNMVTTLMSCPKALAAAENALQQKMQGPSELYIIKESKETAKLFQTTHDGSNFTWQGTFKPEVKYGKGETLYLQVAPQDEGCDTVSYKRCLMVREVTYNAQGIKTFTSNWHLWYEPIEGYQKSPNQGNILRLKRYRTQPTDTKGYGNLYVLDGIVETTELTR